MRFIQPSCSGHWRAARGLIEEYLDWLGLDLSFQDIAHELAHLEDEYVPPAGAFFLAGEGDEWLGCVGLRGFSEDAGEVKRLFVRDAARGRGLGRQLAARAVARAGELGYHRLLLDTLSSMDAARSLYLSLGFVPTSAYRFNPLPGALYLELRLA